MQFGFAFLALFLSIGIAVVWLVIQSGSGPSDVTSQPTSSAISETTYTYEDAANLLVILREGSVCHYTLVQANPADRKLYTVPIPGNLAVDNDNSLDAMLASQGPTKCATALSKATDLTINQYVLMDAEEVESYLSHFEKGVALTLPQAIAVVDSNGATLRLDAGQHTLNAGQIASLLCYDQWNEPLYKTDFAAQLLESLLDTYFNAQQNLGYDFSILSNLWLSALRIHHFSAYKSTLQSIAQSNEGDICQLIHLQETVADNQFIHFDVGASRKATPLYE